MALKIFQCKDSYICDLVSFIFTPDGKRGQHFHNPQILNSGSIFQETFRPPTHLEKECNQFFSRGNLSVMDISKTVLLRPVTILVDKRTEEELLSHYITSN